MGIATYFFEEKVGKNLFIGGGVVVGRKFSIKHECFIGFETPIASLRTSTTDGIELPKLRKPNQRFVFLKFTKLLRRDMQSNVATKIEYCFCEHRRGAPCASVSKIK